MSTEKSEKRNNERSPAANFSLILNNRIAAKPQKFNLRIMILNKIFFAVR
jgi:hypothetical protein